MTTRYRTTHRWEDGRETEDKGCPYDSLAAAKGACFDKAAGKTHQTIQGFDTTGKRPYRQWERQRQGTSWTPWQEVNPRSAPVAA